MKPTFTLVLLWSVCSIYAWSQSFNNGDLNGTIGISVAPTGWAQVPYGDPASQSTSAAQATSDLCSTTGPDVANGINGNPYSGTTLTSGLHMTNVGWLWHEGIQQTVSGLVVGNSYTISYWQTVIKQINALDNTGCWRVYANNTLLGTSAPTTSLMVFNSNSHPWERRTVTFTAAATSLTIKFLPWDNDGNIAGNEGIRMGIDSITLRSSTVLPAALDFNLDLEGTQAVLAWEDVDGENALGYVVERSPNGVAFEEIATLAPEQAGTFRFVDAQPYAESYYRIARREADGSLVYSEIRSIRTQSPLSALVADRMLRIEGGNPGLYQVSLYSLQGSIVYQADVPSSADLQGLQSGVYLVRVVSEGRERAILEKKILLP